MYSFSNFTQLSYSCTATNASCYAYQGCFANVAANGLTSLYSGASTTVDFCSDLATAAYYQYFVLQNGNTCYASNSSASLCSGALSTTCTTACAGGGILPCGGSGANSLFRVSCWSTEFTGQWNIRLNSLAGSNGPIKPAECTNLLLFVPCPPPPPPLNIMQTAVPLPAPPPAPPGNKYTATNCASALSCMATGWKDKMDADGTQSANLSSSDAGTSEAVDGRMHGGKCSGTVAIPAGQLFAPHFSCLLADYRNPRLISDAGSLFSAIPLSRLLAASSALSGFNNICNVAVKGSSLANWVITVRPGLHADCRLQLSAKLFA